VYSRDPTLGYRGIKAMPQKETAKVINRKRVWRLMRLLGLRGIFSRESTT